MNRRTFLGNVQPGVCAMRKLGLWLSLGFLAAACTPNPGPTPDAPDTPSSERPAQPQAAATSPSAAAQAQADAPPPAAAPQIRLRGTVESLNGQTLTVATVMDGTAVVTLLPTVGINGVVRSSLADISANTFVGTTAVKGADGRWHATEVHIFPEAMRGAGEGHYPWDLPESTMTNAAVTGTATAGAGSTLTLRYATGEVAVDVAPETPIVTLVPGDRALLVPGATVFVLGAAAGSTINAFAILAEKDGVKPPM